MFSSISVSDVTCTCASEMFFFFYISHQSTMSVSESAFSAICLWYNLDIIIEFWLIVKENFYNITISHY